MHDDEYREPRRLSGRVLDEAYEIRPERRPTGKRRRRSVARFFAWALLFVLGSAAVGVALLLLRSGPGGFFAFIDSLEPVQAQNAAPPAAPAPPPQIAESNFIGRQAQEWGVRTCLAGIAQLSDYLTRDMDYVWRAQRGTRNADTEMFSGTVAAQERASGLQGVSGLFATPTGDGRCNAGYQTTIYLPAACPVAREKVFPTFSTQIEFGTVVTAFTTADGAATLYLLPAGAAGCVAIKSELFY